MRALKIGNTGRFRLYAAAFDGPRRPQAIIDQDMVRSFVVHDKALTVRGADD
ncbi:hypothetical protein BJY14_006087 [Actinomadura luteofluorescens]|uniref:Uncharacterized protein n=1 Tax=Actinomadura luteofluorescens TaxID=46163 RepID=A0A7Y9ELY6_9ACTN|nr:hypothetical protein [Actinomadura luteofluorescens]NYD50104.1 hypothetical protein [Actinomadura luteofluorescens]